jgi:2-C-methyl-D-erythritol 4-phosphate cytidylyltransferase
MIAPAKGRQGSPTPACSAIVVAAGTSSRMGKKTRKPYLKLRGRPILSWTLAALSRAPGLREIVLVTRPEDRARAAATARLARLPKRLRLIFADGGPRRMDSVYNGIRACSPSSEVVLIHDAARPFPERKAMAAAIAATAQMGAAILAIPIRDTVKKEGAGAGDGQQASIAQTIPRQGLWLAQTPQIFRRPLILALFERLMREDPGTELTDDAAVCERFGQAVALIQASPLNFKVTQPEDLALAEAYIRAGLV